MEDLKMEEFNPTFAELQKIVQQSKEIVVTDLRDEEQLVPVREKREELRRYEIQIEKTGKNARKKAIDFQKAVIAQEKELKSVTTPEIDRLKKIMTEAKDLATRDERLEGLPDKKEKLSKIGDKVVITDDELLEMDYDEFMIYHNQRIADKLELDRAEVEEEKNKIARAKEIKDAEERVKKETEDRIKNAQDTKDREAKEKKEKEELEKKQMTEKLENQVNYHNFLKENNYNDKDFIIKDLGEKVILYKQVAEFVK